MKVCLLSGSSTTLMSSVAETSHVGDWVLNTVPLRWDEPKTPDLMMVQKKKKVKYHVYKYTMTTY